MSAPMIRAILDGTKAPMVRALSGIKTQTRRIVGLNTLKRSETPGYDWTWRGHAPIRSISQQRRHLGGCWQDATEDRFRSLCPYGTVGNRLWVKETWSHDAPDLETCRAAHEDASPGIGYGPYYRATEVAPDTLSWRSPLFMPRWASRITLEITEVRVQRLQDISEDDAHAEGCVCDDEPCDHTRQSCADVGCLGKTHRSSFCTLWDSINAKRAPWASNPWVWALTFRRIP